MKSQITASVLALSAAVSLAQPPPIDLAPPSGATNFAVVGITRNQTLRLNVVASGGTCVAQLGFQDSNGNPIGPTLDVDLATGQSASLSVNGNSVGEGAEAGRVSIAEFVISIQDTASPQLFQACLATSEVVEKLLDNTTVLIPAVPSWPANPVFGTLGVTIFQTARLNVVAYPPNPCIGTISFADQNGNVIGKPMEVNLSPGQATFMDLPGSTVVTGLGKSAEIQPVVNVQQAGAPNACIASTEIYNNLTGETAVYFPPGPCSPTATACVTRP
jgi:hypothetical protein